MHKTNQGVSIYTLDQEHQHQKSSYYIPDNTKNKVIELAKQGYAPSYISQWLRDNIQNDFIEMSSKKISSLLSRSKIKYSQAAGPTEVSKITLKALEEWCNSRTDLPENLDQLFTSKFSCELDNDKQQFHIFATTRRLLEPTQFSNILITDTTYKLNWQGNNFL